MNYREQFSGEREKEERIESEIEQLLEALDVLHEDLYDKLDIEMREKWDEMVKAAHKGKSTEWSREVVLFSLKKFIEVLQAEEERLGV